MNEIATITAAPLTAAQVKEQVAVIQEVLNTVMKPKVHYDVLPGCQKPCLLKPGAEKILVTFRIGSEPVIEYSTDGFDHSFRVVCRGFHIPTGNTVGYGIGDCSTDEDKYKWREAVCNEEFESTPETQRRIHWRKDRNGNVSSVQQVRQNPANLKNTVLKMAAKRAEVDLCRKVTACSDVFEQDLDEEHIAEAAGVQTGSRFQPPQRKPAAPQPPQPGEAVQVITDAQKRRLYAIGKDRGLSDEEMSFINHGVGGVADSRKIPADRYEAVVTAYQAAEAGNVMPQG